MIRNWRVCGGGHSKDYAFLALALPALDLTVAPGSTLWLPCGVLPDSMVTGPVSWIHMHPEKTASVLRLNMTKDTQVREMWVSGTLRGGAVLLLPQATAQDAGTYHCYHGNTTREVHLKVTARAGRVSPSCGASVWGYWEELEASQPWPPNLRASTSPILNPNL